MDFVFELTRNPCGRVEMGLFPDMELSSLALADVNDREVPADFTYPRSSALIRMTPLNEKEECTFCAFPLR
ncbi:MAG: hypothetical protein ABSF17_07555 [Terracidiphilus sp.]|jgi:hypothetical protein